MGALRPVRYDAALLRVPVDADERTIRRAYRARAKELHPDRFPGQGPEDFVAVDEAYRRMRRHERARRWIVDEPIRPGLLLDARA